MAVVARLINFIVVYILCVSSAFNIVNYFTTFYKRTKICKTHGKSVGKGLGRIIDSVVDHIINISKSNPLPGNSYIKPPKELDNPKNALINIQNIDANECLKWCLFRYLDPADLHPERIRKVDTLCEDELDFEDIKFPFKIRDIHKIGKKKCIVISFFGYESKQKYAIYMSKIM